MSKLELEILRQQRLACLGRELGGFVHNAAGPLNIIMGYVQMLRMKYPDEKGISKIWNAGLELDKLLKELGSHIEDVDYGFSQKIRVNRLIVRQMELLRANNFFKHNIEATEDLCAEDPELEMVYGDFLILMDVLLNNAIEAVYHSDIRKIFIVSSIIEKSEGDFLRITVRDTGNGIDVNKIDEYFRPGYSGWENSLNETRGMGLTLAEYICNRLQGSLTLRNSDGIGTEAVLELPIG